MSECVKQPWQWALEALHTLDCAFIASRLKIRFSKRMTASMGRAKFTPRPHGYEALVTLSTPLWERSNEEERRTTVIHEVCHIVACHEAWAAVLPPPKAHGPQWQALMRACGVEPERTHHVNVAGLGRRQFLAVCSCKDHAVTEAFHSKLVQGTKARCTICKDYVRPAGKVIPISK
jgi:SprT protein